MPKKDPGQLTSRQQAFIDNYQGDAVAAVRASGYTGNDRSIATTASRLLKNAEIVKKIKERDVKRLKPLIASREERQQFWTSVANDKNVKMSDRLKASELLAKSNCDFINKVEMSGSLATGPQIVVYLPNNERQIDKPEPVSETIDSLKQEETNDKEK